ncbi:flagellar basal body rod C-terminal domain-containing protein [uncultured Sneathiella sp.]|jgi:flagellar basal-body rod protein FlgC|uniref:flagellar basal body rod protein FlgC n=1 Tax=uncultured Sneathiella sp. TaxID=879315 RepID=UPI0030D8E2DC|tara:strand:+ start:19502 stop:19894 length:393 start_codon:yes stop_codon:yes gene_type:complete
MTTILGSTISGMTAATKRVEVSAQNIVNANTVGTPGAKGENESYKAVEPVQTTDEAGAPTVRVRERDPATVSGFAPNNPLANDEGLIESPNVDLASEIINQNLALHSYKANVKMFEVWNELQKVTLDIKS